MFCLVFSLAVCGVWFLGAKNEGKSKDAHGKNTFQHISPNDWDDGGNRVRGNWKMYLYFYFSVTHIAHTVLLVLSRRHCHTVA